MTRRKTSTVTIKFGKGGTVSVRGGGSPDDVAGAIAFAQAFRARVMSPKPDESAAKDERKDVTP